MRTFPIVLSVLMISGYASADFVRPLKPNPVLCTGTNIEAGKDGLTLEINFTEKDGVIGTEGEYVFDKDLKFEKFNNAQAFNLAFEGNLYIQHLADGYNLLLNEGDLNEIAQGVQDKQYKFKGTLNLQAHGKYNVFCYGFFEK